MSRQFSMSKKNNGGNKKWVHPAEALLRGHIVYTVKFLGCVDVEEPKGTEIVKDAVRKTKFTKQLKKAEGQKVPKVELTISVDGVTVQEPKYKVIQHQYPLHRISYCADDKSDKRIFTFIAKEGDTNEHKCFVFDSEKCAEEITLTIGQAFDLAYKKFMESSSKDMDMKKNYLLMQKKVQQLTQENLQLKARVANLERMIDPALLDDLDKKQKQENNTLTSTPSRPTAAPVVGRKLENLVFEDNFTDQQPQPAQNGTASPATPVLAPPPPVPPRQNSAQRPTAAGGTPQNQGVDEFGSPPFKVANNNTKSGAQDPFGMGTFNPQEIDRQIQSVDRELLDLHTGFSQGLSFGPDDFNLADLDPLNQK